MTGPEQHAATVERPQSKLRSFIYGEWGSIGDERARALLAALDELVALASEAERLAGRADELERRLRDAPLGGDGSHWVDCWRSHIDCAVHRVEAAEARADELQREWDEARFPEIDESLLPDTVSGASWDPGTLTALAEAHCRHAWDHNMEVKAWVVLTILRERVQARREADQLRAALEEIAKPSPRSYRREVEQLRDAVKWRQGIARDALARAALAGPTLSDGQAEPGPGVQAEEQE